MGTVVLNGATSGSTTLVPTDAVTATLTLPSATGTLLAGSTSQLAKAWGQCAFNSGSNLSLTSSYNISSLTRNSSGNYTFNYTTNLNSANYCVVGTANNGGSVNSAILNPTGRNISSVTLNTGYVSATNGTLSQYDYGIDFAVFGS
jgi:hypothetical protein